MSDARQRALSRALRSPSVVNVHRARRSSALVGVWLVVNFVKDPTEFVNVAPRSGSRTARSTALVALGYTLVYGILQLINFAHGDVFMLSGLVASTMHRLACSGSTRTRATLVVVGGHRRHAR